MLEKHAAIFILIMIGRLLCAQDVPAESLSGDAYVAQQRERCAELHQQWKEETDATKKRALQEDLINAAVHAEQPEILIEIATAGTYEQKQIQIPKSLVSVPLTVLMDFGEPPRKPYDDALDFVIRRITATTFELWMPRRGWLFGPDGRLLNTAKPPRRDGIGREWHGAFLPDGRWVTTDLWDYDRTLTFFSGAGKWVKEIPSQKLVPPNREDPSERVLIGWCRADKDGKGWVVSVGSEGGRGVAWVSPESEPRVLKNREEPWQLCYPRDLEPKGMYTVLSIPNDAGDVRMRRTEAGHGDFVGYPRFFRNTGDEVIVPSGNDHFGFWPGSNNVFIGVDNQVKVKPMKMKDGEMEEPPEFKNIEHTWFFDANGTFQGWIAAGRIGDDSAVKGAMLFADEKGRVITLAPDRAVRAVRSFKLRGSALKPAKIFPDLHVGFFENGKKLLLAKWSEKK